MGSGYLLFFAWRGGGAFLGGGDLIDYIFTSN